MQLSSWECFSLVLQSWHVEITNFIQTSMVRKKPPPNLLFRVFRVLISDLAGIRNLLWPSSEHIKPLSTSWQTQVQSALPAASQESKEEREREQNKKHHLVLTALEEEGWKYKILPRFCRVNVWAYTLATRALLKNEENESSGNKKREGSNLISTALKGRALAPASDSPR